MTAEFTGIFILQFIESNWDPTFPHLKLSYKFSKKKETVSTGVERDLG